MTLSNLRKIVTPPNSVILIEDQIGGDIPESMGNSIVASTRSCIAVGCKSEMDGETELRLSRDTNSDVHGFLLFDGMISVPSRKIAVKTIFDEIILDMKLNKKEIKIKIITNDEFQPEKIEIIVRD